MMRQAIVDKLIEIYEREVGDSSGLTLSDDVVLLETGLDSLGFAMLVVELEEELGFDPFSLSTEPYYPQTLGEFVQFYERYKPD